MSSYIIWFLCKKVANPKSDLDFIIDTKGTLMGFDFFALIDEIEKIFKKNIDAFEKVEIIENSKIDNEIKKTGVVVYEKYLPCSKELQEDIKNYEGEYEDLNVVE